MHAKSLNHVWLFSHVWLFATPQTVDCKAPPSVGLSRQEHWSSLPCPSPIYKVCIIYYGASQVVLVAKNLPAKAGDTRLVPGWRRFPGGRHVYPLQYSCLESSMDRGAWRTIVHGVPKSQTQLSNWALLLCCDYIEMIPDIRFQLIFFNFMMMWKQLTYFECWSFSQLAISRTVLGSWAGAAAELPASCTITRVNSGYTYNRSLPTTPFSFSLPVQSSMNYMIYLAPYYKINCVRWCAQL